MWVLLALFVVMAILPFVIKKDPLYPLLMQYYDVCNSGRLPECDQWIQRTDVSRTGRLLRYRRIYPVQLLSKNFGISFWLLLLVGGILAMLVGFIVSLQEQLRLNGIYLSITTLGASEIIRIIAQTWTPVTGGSLGIEPDPLSVLASAWICSSRSIVYFIFLFLLVLFLFVTNRVLKSRVGRAWMSIREDRDRSKVSWC